jgi:hypothetical protein
MAGTSPTSWYTHPDKRQHIAYVGFAGGRQINECHFAYTPGAFQWEYSEPSKGFTPVRAGTSPTSWYTPTDNPQHIAYVGTDHQIHEVLWLLDQGPRNICVKRSGSTRLAFRKQQRGQPDPTETTPIDGPGDLPERYRAAWEAPTPRRPPNRNQGAARYAGENLDRVRRLGPLARTPVRPVPEKRVS